MSQSLRRDVELLATFDNDHTDAANGVVKDFSGKQRHLQASGGPTYGQSSPVGEAVGFDGTDDFFDVGDPLAAQEQTLFAIVSTDTSGTNQDLINVDDGSNGYRLRFSLNDLWSFRIRDGSGNGVAVNTPVVGTSQFNRIIAVYDGDSVRIFRNGVLEDKSSVSTHNQAVEDVQIGASFNGSNPFSGRVAAVARWSRALSDSEIEELNRMTDRMVSRL